MKKFTLFILLCMAALCLPQDVLADDVTVVKSGTTATITSNVAGALNNSTGAKSAINGCTELIFVGQFNSADLTAAATNASSAIKVDMTDAFFPAVEALGQNFYLYDTAENLNARGAQQSGDLDRAIVGGTLFQLTRTETRQWAGLNAIPAEGGTEVVYADQTALTDATNTAAVGTIGKIASTTYYCQLTETYNQYGGLVRSWSEAQTTKPDSVTEERIPLDENGKSIDYDRRNNHTSGTNLVVNNWYKFTKYTYYRLDNTITRTWNSISYTNGQTKENLSIVGVYDHQNDMETSLLDAADGTKALVLGTRYRYDSTVTSGDKWVETTGYQANVYDWSQVRFSGWSSTLEEAITPKNILWANGYRHGTTEGAAVTNGLSSYAFKDCTKLKKVTYMSGNAIGFQDTQDNYALEEVVFGDSVTWINDGAFQRCKTLKKFSFTNPCSTTGPDLYIDGGAFAEATEAEIDGKFPNRLKAIFTRAFFEAKVGKLEVCEDDGLSRLTEFGNTAFGSSKVSEIVVPLSVTTIKANAFQASNHLSKITFLKNIGSVTNTNSLTIETSAFTGGNEGAAPNLDVYLNFSPNDRMIICQYDAFNYTQMQGQTDDKSGKFGRLHFNVDDWDYYQGNWKKGLAFRQENLNAFKDGYNDSEKKYFGKSSNAIDSSTGKYEYSGDGQYTPANGWQQFSLTDTGIDIPIPRGSFMRSYSTATSYNIPTHAQNGNGYSQGDQMFKAYRVTNFTDNYTSGNTNDQSAATSANPVATATEVPKYLPKNTGLILSGNMDASYLVYLDAVTGTPDDLIEYPYQQNPSAEKPNLLYPACIGPFVTPKDSIDRVLINPTDPYPIFKNNNNADENYRVFVFKKSPLSFSRVKPNVKLNFDKAYLKLPVTLFHWSNEAQYGAGSGVTDPTSGAKVAIIFGDLDEFSETTGISNVIDSTKENANVEGYFTLQGVKVEAPTQKGIYIHNGKKIMVK